MQIRAENIRKALSQALPGAAAHRKMLPIDRTLTVPKNEKGIKHSSVLLLLFEENEELMVCLIKRPRHMKYHPGQIALPGGRIEKGETALETAFRETFEEIGIPKEEIEIVGSLSELYVEVSKFRIHPFVGWLKKRPNVINNPNEVDKTIFFPLKYFTHLPDETEITTVKGKIKVPCIKFEGEIIWGATSMILAEFADLLVEQSIFQ